MDIINKNLAARACVNRELNKAYYKRYKYVVITPWMFLDYDKEDPVGIYNSAKIFMKCFNKKAYETKEFENSDGEYLVMEIKNNLYLKIYSRLRRKKFLREYVDRRFSEHIFKRNYEDSNDGEFYITITKEELKSIGINMSTGRFYKEVLEIIKSKIARERTIAYGDGEIQVAWSYH